MKRSSDAFADLGARVKKLEERALQRIVDDSGDPVLTWQGGRTGLEGAIGPQGPAGADGMTPATRLLWDSGTASADPGSGHLRFNNATLGSVTELYVSDTDDDGNAWGAWQNVWDDSTSTNKGHIWIFNEDRDAFFLCRINSTVTDNGTWHTIPVEPISNGGSFADEEPITILFTRTGDKGDTGNTGSSGGTGAAGASAGLIYVFDSSTGSADPGAGEIRLNNATPASATAIYIDTTSQGATVTSFINSWDDSTSTVKGYVFLREVGATNFAVYQVTSVTDNTGWHTVAVTYVLGTGSFSASDSISVQFVRTGDKGDTGAAGSVDAAWPVGSVFIAVVSTNPATLLGVGTWSAFGAGRMLVGRDSGDGDFDTAEETGGAKTVTLVDGNIPSNTLLSFQVGTGASISRATGGHGGGAASSAVNKLPPYIVVYMWKRTA